MGSELDVVQTQVCRTQDEVLATGEELEAGMGA